MQTDRSDDVVARVVAWHNRHPLATRITATQVHSVGVVSLPFAVRGAVVQAVPEPATETAATETVATETAATETPAPDTATLETAAVQAPVEPAAPVAAASVAAVNAVDAQLPPRPARWNPLARWRGRAAWRALFSEDFIAPLRPARIARWAAQHAVSERPLGPDSPQRDVVLDAARRSAGSDAPELPLFLLTAAIGVDDQRLRVLLAPTGRAVIGPRHFSRPRVVALAGSSLTVLALLVGAGLWQQQKTQAVMTVAAASAPVAASAAAAQASAAASQPTAVALAAAASAASAPEAESAAKARAEPAAERATEPAAEVAAAAATEPIPASAEPAATPTAQAPLHPGGARPRRGRVELAPLVDKLDDGQRHELRQAGRALRGEPAHPVDARSWALVTRPLPDRRQSERVAAQLQAVALLQPMPMRAELMRADGGWRAVFWPFPTERDAEKVRLALADKGLRTQIIEF